MEREEEGVVQARLVGTDGARVTLAVALSLALRGKCDGNAIEDAMGIREGAGNELLVEHLHADD